jgi:hypothetical protein
MYILHHRGHLNAFLFILAILIWPLALIASLMLPLDYWNRTPTWNRTATYGYEPVTKVTRNTSPANPETRPCRAGSVRPLRGAMPHDNVRTGANKNWEASLLALL